VFSNISILAVTPVFCLQHHAILILQTASDFEPQR
jgi:hypothetical protein